MNAVVNVIKDDIAVNLYDASGVGRAGLTVTGTARQKGVTVSASAVADRGNGAYDLTILFPTVGTWQITASATIDGEPAIDITDVQVVTAAQADPAAALAGVAVTVVSPLSADGSSIHLVQGDSYAATQSRQIAFDLSGQPDLTGATVTLVIVCGATLTKIVAVTDAGLSTQAGSVQLTVADTASLSPAAAGSFELSATAGSDRWRMLSGTVAVVASFAAS
jgi:hypothetical protein